jgi:hypothetical protein
MYVRAGTKAYLLYIKELGPGCSSLEGGVGPENLFRSAVPSLARKDAQGAVLCREPFQNFEHAGPLG